MFFRSELHTAIYVLVIMINILGKKTDKMVIFGYNLGEVQ